MGASPDDAHVISVDKDPIDDNAYVSDYQSTWRSSDDNGIIYNHANNVQYYDNNNDGNDDDDNANGSDHQSKYHDDDDNANSSDHQSKYHNDTDIRLSNEVLIEDDVIDIDIDSNANDSDNQSTSNSPAIISVTSIDRSSNDTTIIISLAHHRMIVLLIRSIIIMGSCFMIQLPKQNSNGDGTTITDVYSNDGNKINNNNINDVNVDINHTYCYEENINNNDEWNIDDDIDKVAKKFIIITKEELNLVTQLNNASGNVNESNYHDNNGNANGSVLQSMYQPRSTSTHTNGNGSINVDTNHHVDSNMTTAPTIVDTPHNHNGNINNDNIMGISLYAYDVDMVDNNRGELFLIQYYDNNDDDNDNSGSVRHDDNASASVHQSKYHDNNCYANGSVLQSAYQPTSTTSATSRSSGNVVVINVIADGSTNIDPSSIRDIANGSKTCTNDNTISRRNERVTVQSLSHLMCVLLV